MQIIGSLFHDYFSMSVQLYSHWIMFPLYFQHLFEKLFKTQNKLHCTNANKSHRAFFIFVLWNKGTHSLFKTYSIIMYSNLPLIKDETSMFVWVQWSVSMAEISTFFYSRSCPIFQWRIQDFFKEANHQKFLSHSISNHNFLVR